MTFADAQVPAVSVIVPLYDKGPYIERCLGSIQKQTFTAFELIVVDDGSNDEGPATVERMKDCRTRLIRQANAGVSAARNRGLKESRAPLIAFLDADDEWLPKFLETIVSVANAFPQAGLMATGFKRCRKGLPEQNVFLADAKERMIQFDDYLQRVCAGDFVHSSCVMVRRQVFDIVGAFQEGQPIGEDVDLWARISLQFPFAYDPGILAVYHSEAENGSFERWKKNPPFPPVVNTLRTLLAQGKIPQHRVNEVKVYLDFRLIKYGQWLLHLGLRTPLLALLSGHQWYARLYWHEAMLLKAALSILPVRLVFALRWKLAPFWTLVSKKARKNKSTLIITLDRSAVRSSLRAGGGPCAT